MTTATKDFPLYPQKAPALRAAARRLATGTQLTIKGVDVLDAIIAEGVLHEAERIARGQVEDAENSGDFESAALIENRVQRFVRFRAAVERAVYGTPGLDSPYGAGEGVEASRG